MQCPFAERSSQPWLALALTCQVVANSSPYFCCVCLRFSLLCHADGQPRTKCVILAHLDTGMSYIPGFIVSFVLKVDLYPLE